MVNSMANTHFTCAVSIEHPTRINDLVGRGGCSLVASKLLAGGPTRDNRSQQGTVRLLGLHDG